MNEDRQVTYQGVTYKLHKYQTRSDKLKGRSGQTVWAPVGSDDRTPSDYVFPQEKKFQAIDKAFWPGARSGPEDDFDPAKLTPKERQRLNDLDIELLTVPIEDKREVEARIEKLWQSHAKRETEKKKVSESECKKGQCYKSAYQYVAKNHRATLVHAIVKGRGKIEGVKFGHAWAEYRKNGVMTAYDPTVDIEMPAKIYRMMGKAKNVETYSWREAMKMADKSGVYGPWSKEISKSAHAKNSKKTLEAIEWLNKKYDAMTDDEHTEHFLGEAKKRKKKCKKCTGYGCYYCGYRGYLFAPFYGKGDGTSAAAISTGPGGSSGSGGGPAFPGAGGVNAPGVPGGPNSGMGSSMSYDGNALMADIDAIGRLCERTRTTGSVQNRSEVNLYRELD